MRIELRPLVALAECLDKSRGDYYDGDTGNQPKGTNYAESLYNLVCRLELETSGPTGRE